MAQHRSHYQWVLSLFGVCTWLCLLDAAAVHFLYHGPNGVEKWSDLFKECGGRRQSSVALARQTAIPVSFGPFNFVNYDFVPSNSTLLNNGHAVQVSVTHPTKLPLILRGGGLLGDYEFLHFHFHWGVSSSKGSEHTIDRKRFPMEMHLVHYKKEYETPQAAMNHHDGIAVVAVMFKRTRRDNPNLKPLLSHLNRIRQEGEEYTFSGPLNIMRILPKNKISFYRYEGSLTTPKCQEVVVWTIFDTPVSISEKQLIQFRKINGFENQSIADNFRPIQDLNGRNVFVNEPRTARIECHVPFICSVFRDLLRVIDTGDRFLIYT